MLSSQLSLPPGRLNPVIATTPPVNTQPYAFCSCKLLNRMNVNHLGINSRLKYSKHIKRNSSLRVNCIQTLIKQGIRRIGSFLTLSKGRSLNSNASQIFQLQKYISRWFKVISLSDFLEGKRGERRKKKEKGKIEVLKDLQQPSELNFPPPLYL